MEEFQECLDNLEESPLVDDAKGLVLSLHSLKGSQGQNTIRLATYIGHTRVIVLIDFGNTHNFISTKVVRL